MSEQPHEALKGEPAIDPRNEPDGIKPEALEPEDGRKRPADHPGEDGDDVMPRPVP